jgi:hypothetical protein
MCHRILFLAILGVASPALAQRPAMAPKDNGSLAGRMLRGTARATFGAGWRAMTSMAQGDLLGSMGHLNPVDVGLKAIQHTVSPNAVPHDKSTWVWNPSPNQKVRQRGMISDEGKIYCETEVHVNAPSWFVAKYTAQAVRKSWTPWYGGGYKALDKIEFKERTGHEPAEGAITYELAPSGYGPKVTEQAIPHLKGDHLTVDISLKGDAEGPAELRVQPNGSGATLTGEFKGVQPGGTSKALGSSLFTEIHLSAEGGTRLLPKTGIGLLEERGLSRLASDIEAAWAKESAGRAQ